MSVARIERGPSGSFNSKLDTGASGTLLNVEVVIPFLMLVFPSKYSVIPSPCRTITRSGNATPPWDTRYAGPVSGLLSTGVCAVAIPTADAAGHAAGL